MTKSRLPAAALAALALVAQPAHAQHIVHDPTSYAKLVEEARTALEQLRALQQQVEQGQALLDSLNSLSGVNALADELGLPDVRRPLRELQAAADGDLDAVGALAERADAIRRQTRLHTPPADGADSVAAAYYRESLERAGARTARDLAVGEAIAAAADRRVEGLEDLRRSLDTAPNARAVMDLQARLAAEQALIDNEQTRLQGLAITRDAEARLEAQQARERAEAARAARMRLYEQAFQ